MPIISDSSYRPVYPFRNAHLNTIYPNLFRRVKSLSFQRQRIDTPDGDFLDLDFSTCDSKTAVLVVHGLEGNSYSGYASGLALAANRQGWDAIAMNLRGCSGEANRTHGAYHSGKTDDLDTAVQHLMKSHHYKEIILCGFSLGGNLVLKYAGEKGSQLPEIIKATVGVSVPCDLEGSARKLARLSNRAYLIRFLRTLKQKVRNKIRDHEDFPIQLNDLQRVRNFEDFDNLYTAPLHGFKNASDYYQQSSCHFYLYDIQVPTLLINALDDPFLTPECFPFSAATANPNLHFETPKFGGHVGFLTSKRLSIPPWHEDRIMDFLSMVGLQN